MTPEDLHYQDEFRNGPTNFHGIRIAIFRFGAFFWVCIAAVGIFMILNLERLSVYFVVFRTVDLLSMLAISAALTLSIFYIHERSIRLRTSEDSLPILVISSLVLSVIGSALWAGLHQFYPAIFGLQHPEPFDMAGFSIRLAIAGGVLLSWACMIVALIFAFELNDRKIRLAAIREEALGAQMRALRYQVNPHFLFNTLNSIAGLIEEGSTDQAERMVLSLSTFLRTTLALDPFNDVLLAEEIALQEEYLSIEQERFSDRLNFSIAVDGDAANGLVPSLILQPLIENAIKHGVGVTRGKVGISLEAYRRDDRLCIGIENDMPSEKELPFARPIGMGVGLQNVADRLRARFGNDCLIQSGPTSSNCFKVALELPWQTK